MSSKFTLRDLPIDLQVQVLDYLPWWEYGPNCILHDVNPIIEQALQYNQVDTIWRTVQTQTLIDQHNNTV